MNDLSELRHAFAEWLDPRGSGAARGDHQDHHPPEAVRVAESPSTSSNGHAAPDAPIVRRTPGELLYALWDDHTALPMGLRALHQLPADTSYSDLARVLYMHWDTADVTSLEVARDGLAERDVQDLQAEFEQVRRTGMATA